MTRRAEILVIAVSVSLFAVMAWLLISDQPLSSSAAAAPQTSVSLARSPKSEEWPKRSPGVRPRSPIDPARPVITGTSAPALALEEGRSPLADKLHAPENNGSQDAAIVMNLFTEYRARFRGFPVGEDNSAFVRALTGHNPGRIALLPPDHPAIDGQGQLLDRWGKPFFFHLLDREAVEVRSAGPDRNLYTADDIVKKSPQAEAARLANREN